MTRNMEISYLVSRLENFFATTLPSSIPSRSTIFCAKSGWEDPLNTFMLGILPLLKRWLIDNLGEKVEASLFAGCSRERARFWWIRPDGISFQLITSSPRPRWRLSASCNCRIYLRFTTWYKRPKPFPLETKLGTIQKWISYFDYE